jgi:hypothetical protein
VEQHALVGVGVRGPRGLPGRGLAPGGHALLDIFESGPADERGMGLLQKLVDGSELQQMPHNQGHKPIHSRSTS